eukprot:g3583.t1
MRKPAGLLPSIVSFYIITFTLLSKGLFCCQMFGLAYTPYRIPDICPTEEEVEEDLQYLWRHTRRVRTYSMGCMTVNRVFLKHASEGRLSVLLGVWIDGMEQDKEEINRLMTVLAEFPYADFAGIAVGNEVALRETMTNSDLVQTVISVRDEIRQLAVANSSRALNEVPVFTIEIIPIPALVAASDMLAINIHPFYRRDLQHTPDPEVMANRILEATAHQIDFYRNMAPEKQIVVTEIGWPTESAPNDVGVGDPEIAFRFLQKFVEYCAIQDIQYYWFELFDSLWKKASFPTQPDSLSEFHWGIYKGDRKTPKFRDHIGCSG